MKKKLAVLLTFVLIISLCVVGTADNQKAYAREAQMYLEIPESIKKENEFTVSVVLNSDVELYSIDAYLSYNTDLLEYVPDNDKVSGAAGVLELKDTFAAETTKATYKLTFKALDTGSAKIALTDVFLIDYADLDYIEVAPSVKNFDIGINKKIAADARLSDLIVAPGTLSEPFNPDILEYEAYVDLDVETICLSAIPMDEGSVVGLEMPEKLQMGENIITITVTALSGTTNTYILKVYRQELENDTETQSSEDISSEEVSTEEKNTEVTTQEQTTQEMTTQTTSSEGTSEELEATTESSTEVPTEEVN